ncbi:MAG: YybH family protein, partial [Planctomycetia bacterium]
MVWKSSLRWAVLIGCVVGSSMTAVAQPAAKEAKKAEAPAKVAPAEVDPATDAPVKAAPAKAAPAKAATVKPAPALPKPSSPAEADAVEQVRAFRKTYLEAYNKRDAKTLSSYWSPKGEYLAPDGRKIVGREAIEKTFAGLFEEVGDLRLEVLDLQVRLISPDVAVEEGTAVVARTGSEPSERTYLAVLVRDDDGWLLDSTRETTLPNVPSNYGQLKELEWMVGEWLDAGDG